jgi:prepilin-type N-terminal cleavage/methylation domain-containing protein
MKYSNGESGLGISARAAGTATIPKSACLRRNSNAGFTLLEVVIAVVLVGIAFGALLQAFSQSLRNIRRIDVYQVGMQKAQNKMNELLIDDEVISDGVLEGTWDENFRWRAALETREVEDLAVDKSRLTTRLLYIRLTVHYLFEGKDRQIKLFTTKLVPKPQVGEQGYLGGGGPFAR